MVLRCRLDTPQGQRSFSGRIHLKRLVQHSANSERLSDRVWLEAIEANIRLHFSQADLADLADTPFT